MHIQPHAAATSDRPVETPGRQASRHVLWIGATTGLELGMARAALAAHAQVSEIEHPRDAEGVVQPVFAVLASDRPGRFTVADAVSLSLRWPLTPIVSVASSLVEGRRRSGPQLPGLEEVPWYDLGGRSGWWLAALDAGLPTSLGTPATSRREERLLESLAALRGRGLPSWTPLDVSVAAGKDIDLEGICDLLTTAGHRIAHRSRGRPRIDESATTLVWDVDALVPDQLAWLRLLAANRPALRIVILDSFPRGDSAASAIQAGAEAVLGRPVSLEALLGTLMPHKYPANRPQDGLGPRPPGR